MRVHKDLSSRVVLFLSFVFFLLRIATRAFGQHGFGDHVFFCCYSHQRGRKSEVRDKSKQRRGYVCAHRASFMNDGMITTRFYNGSLKCHLLFKIG
ncbi:hypothetical protein GE21DRAFT_1036306 [Neurospora crassa]|nr:hypothetical protein GE21DRAFT_1036306 [Neurospora crassa]